MTSAQPDPTETSVRLTRVYAAPIEHLFDCFTDPKLVAQWWGPSGTYCPEATNELAVGKSFRFVMKGEETGRLSVSYGEYLVIDRPHRLVFTWNWEHEPDETTRVSLQFRALGADRTELTLVHDRFPNAARAALHKTGWTSSLDRLAVAADRAASYAAQSN